jgi:ATP phosphoribosyltransferase
MNTKLKIVIQKKGKLTQNSLQFLEELGCKFNIEEGSRKLLVQSENADLLLTRDDDIPQLVSLGIADIGIIGKDVLLESKIPVKTIRELNFGECRISFASNNPKISKLEDLQGKTIATSYMNMVREFLKKNNIEAKTIYLAGGVEIAPSIGLADLIADSVSSGRTLKENNLTEIIKIIDVNAVLIGNPNMNESTEILVEKFLNKQLVEIEN